MPNLFTTTPVEIVFIFDDLADWQQLAEAAREAGHEVSVLSGHADGLAQMESYLHGRDEVDAIHIVSHGSPGCLRLGSLMLDQAALGEHANSLAQIGSALSHQGDILLYGCDVAADAHGEAFLESLSNLTGADVAASTNLTGSTAAGGDWELEARTSAVEAGSVWAQYSQYSTVLADQTINLGGALTSGSLASGNFSIGGISIAITSDSGFTISQTAGGILVEENAQAGNFTFTITDPAPNGQFSAKSIYIDNTSTGGEPGWGAYLAIENYTTPIVTASLPETQYTGNYNFYFTNDLTSGGTYYIGNQVIIRDLEQNGYQVKSRFFIKDFVVDLAATNDATPPTVSSIARLNPATALTNADSLVFRVTFSESVSNLSTGDFTVSGSTATVTSVGSAGANACDVTVSGGDLANYSGTVALAFSAGQNITDGAGNALTNTTPTGGNDSYTLDNTAPSVTSVNSSTANGSYQSGDVVSIQVNFSEAVTVTGTPQLTLETGATDRVVNYASGSGTSSLTFTYTVQVGDSTADLDYVNTAALALNSGTIRDAASNNATLTLTAPGSAGSLGANKNIVIDSVAPTVSGVTSSTANGFYKPGDVIAIQVNFSEAVTVTGTPQLTLETGTTDQVINYASGSGTSTLTFNYTIQAGDTSADLDYLSAASLALNSGTIRDAAGNDATLTLATPGAAGSLGANKNIVVDSIAPSHTGNTVPTDGTYALGQTLHFTVSYSEAVTVNTGGGTPYVALTLDTGGSVQAAYVSGTGTNTLTFSYTTTAGNQDSNGVTVGSSIVLNGGTIRDTAGNNAVTSGITFASTAGVLIDALSPSVSSINRVGSASTNATSVDYTVTFSESVTGVDTSDFTLTATGTAAGTVASVSGAGSTYTITVSGVSGEGTLRLDLNNAGTGISDGAGNGTSTGFTSGQSYTLDHTAPSAPSIPDLTAGSDSGASSTDNVTNDTTPSFTGTAEANSSVTLYDTDGTTVLGSTTADGSGNWSITSSALAAGAHTLTAKATDLAGNVSAASAGLAVTIDAAAPAAPSAPDLAAGSDSGVSSTDNITSVTTPTVTGTAEANSSVKLYDTDGTTVLGTTTADGSGNWSLTSSALAAGAHTLTAKATDLAGNVSVASAGLAVTIDATAPGAPSAPDLAAGSDSGVSSTDNITSVITPTVTGTAEANSSVKLYDTDGTTVLGSTTADGSGNWSITSSALAAGAHTLTAKATDLAGNVSVASAGLTVTIDPDAPVFTAATVNGNTIVLTYTEASTLDAANPPLPGDFAVHVGGMLNAVMTLAVNAASKTVTLTLTTAVSAGQVVTVSYTDPTGGNDANAMQDAAGNDAATLASTAVTNNTPAPDPGPAPSTPVDGVPVTTTSGDGGTSIITIPVVQPTRPDDPSSPNTNLADIPLVTAPDGHSIVQVSVPVGVGLQAQGLPSPVSGDAAVTELGLRIDRIAGGNAELTNNGQTFLATLDPSEPLTVQTITATAGAGFNPEVPFVISGSTAPADGKQAVLVDARALPSGTLIQVDNIDFVAIVGAVRVIGGAGQNAASGDSSAQWIVLGADDDVIHGGGGNDVVASKGGNDRLYGDDGDDTVVGGVGDDHLEGGTGNDLLQGGMSDAGAWSFALSPDGNMHASYNASQGLLTDTHNASAVGRWSGSDVLDARIALVYQDYAQLETISLLFQGLTGELPALQAMNTLSTQGWSQDQLLQAAWTWYEGTLPANASAREKMQALIGKTWGPEHATEQNTQIGLDYLAQGGRWSEGLGYLVAHANVRGQITSEGRLNLTQAGQIGEAGWGLDSGNDVLIGGEGNDVLIGGNGNDILDGGAGTDLAAFLGALPHFSVQLRASTASGAAAGQQEVVLRNALSGEEDILRDVELLQIGGQAYRIEWEGLQTQDTYQPLAEHVQGVNALEVVLVGLPGF